MNSLELLVKNRTDKGSVHLELKSSGDELGILYLTQDQYNDLVCVLRTGCFNKEVDFHLDDPYNAEDDEVEENNPYNFFSID